MSKSKLNGDFDGDRAITKAPTAHTTDVDNNTTYIQYGWVCPKCGKVNAPWKDSCDCVNGKWESYPLDQNYPLDPCWYRWTSAVLDEANNSNFLGGHCELF